MTRQVPSEQTESHRLIEHLMIAANEAVATLLETRKLPALFRVHERPEPARVERLLEQLASLDVPTPPLPPAMTPQQAGDVVAEISRLVGAGGRAAGMDARSRRWCCARSSRRTTRRATSATPACARRATATSRRRSAATRTSSATARCCRDRRGEDLPGASRLDEPPSGAQRERDAMAIERDADSVARCFLLESELFESGWDRSRAR